MGNANRKCKGPRGKRTGQTHSVLISDYLGNVMPKARMNSTFGLRTTWSMKNERVWQKSQRLGGIALVVGGIVTILLMIFVRGPWCMLVLGIVIAVVLAVSIIGSRRYYKQDLVEHPDDRE